MQQPVSTLVEDEKLTEVEWTTHSFSIGIKRGDDKEQWLPLDRTDLQMLIWLLRKPVIPGVLPAADASDGLEKLARWAEIAKDFAEERGLP